MVRLQKFLAESGVASRRKCEELIVSGVVKVNGEVVEILGSKVDPEKDKVTVQGKGVMRINKKRIYLFFKPVNVITTVSDPQERPCVGDYLKNIPERVFPVGRLDFDVTGLLILTNDGDFAEKLLHPRYEVERKYWALVEGDVTPDELSELCEGIELEDGIGQASAARILQQSPESRQRVGSVRGDESLVELVVTEGRKHFVKKILGAIGHPVIKLCRVSFGEYELGDLKPGEIVEFGFKN